MVSEIRVSLVKTMRTAFPVLVQGGKTTNYKDWISRLLGELSDSGSCLPMTKGYLSDDLEIKVVLLTTDFSLKDHGSFALTKGFILTEIHQVVRNKIKNFYDD